MIDCKVFVLAGVAQALIVVEKGLRNTIRHRQFLRSVVRQIFTQWVEIFSAAAFFLLVIYDRFRGLQYECLE